MVSVWEESLLSDCRGLWDLARIGPVATEIVRVGCCSFAIEGLLVVAFSVAEWIPYSDGLPDPTDDPSTDLPASRRLISLPGLRLSSVTQGIPAEMQAWQEGCCSSQRVLRFRQ